MNAPPVRAGAWPLLFSRRGSGINDNQRNDLAMREDRPRSAPPSRREQKSTRDPRPAVFVREPPGGQSWRDWTGTIVAL